MVVLVFENPTYLCQIDETYRKNYRFYTNMILSNVGRKVGRKSYVLFV